MLGRALVVLVALVALAPSAAAWRAPGEGTLTTDAAVLATGSFLAEAARGVLIARGPGAFEATSLDIVSDEASIEIVTVRIRAFRTPAGDVGYAPEHAVERLRPVQGMIHLVPGKGFEMAAIVDATAPGDVLRIAAQAASHPLELNASGIDYSYRMKESLPYFFEAELPGPTLVINPTPSLRGQAIMEGAFVVYATGVRVVATVDGRQIERELGAHEEPVVPGVGPYVARTDVYSYARIEQTSGRLATGALVGDVVAGVAATSVDVDGSLSCSPCDAVLSMPGRSYVVSDETVVVTGQFAVELPHDGSRSHRIQGEVDQALLGRHVRYDDPVKLTLLGALGVAVLALYRAVIEASARLAATLYTRITKADVLESRERSAIVRRIGEDPGIHMRALQRELGYGWGKLHYHVRVLERTGEIVLERRGKNVHAFRPGAESRGGAAVLKARGAAFAVYEALRARGEATAAELAGDLAISRQLASYHLRKLRAEGVVKSAGWPARFRPRDEPPPLWDVAAH